MKPAIEKYEHHGTEVSVISEFKGRHRDLCLCWQDCKKFHPSSPVEGANCPIAKAVFENCVIYDLVTPVLECARYEKGDEA